MELGPIVFDISGTQMSLEDKELLRHPLCGGIILFSRNYEAPEQLDQLVKEIRQTHPSCLIMVDQEGGRVQRFKEGFTRLPHLRLLGNLYDADPSSLQACLQFSRQLGEIMAIEVCSFGLDLSLAPVVDLDRGISAVIGDRAFHTDPNIVIELARAYVLGMQNAGMKATIKHFPGHGSVAPDSHHELPIDDRLEADIAIDMKPFRTLVQEPNVKAVMPAHIIYEKFDKNPPCFSRYWLQTVLREQLGFTGAIISDDMSMEAAACMGSYSDRTQSALEAGCDIVLACNNRPAMIEALDNLRFTMTKESYYRVADLRSNANSRWESLQSNKLWLHAQEGLKKFSGMCAGLNPAMV